MFAKEEFVRRCKASHGDKYNYNKTEYKGSTAKVKITCPRHGEFEQLASDHWRGRGCPQCVGLKRSNTGKFVEKAKIRHGPKYDYTKTQYSNNHTVVTITCPRHGEFLQTPNNHLRGQGCPQCHNEAKFSTTEEFVKKAKLIHGDFYDYSKVEYCRNKKHVTIVCPRHGDFMQLPLHHLQSSGCPTCSESKGERKVRQFLESRGCKFKTEWRFVDCKNKIPLPFDFIVFQDNSLILIEFNGKHHYKKVAFGGTSNAATIYKQTLKHDQIKTTYCQENGYKLIVIPYYDIDRTEEILEQSLASDTSPTTGLI